jgi:hypothetical protein
MLRRSLVLLVIWIVSALVHAQTTGQLQLQTKTLPAAPIGTHYKATIQVSGGTPPLRWRVIRGTLPGGLALQPGSGTVIGTPTEPGRSSFTIEITDAQSKKLVQDFTLEVKDFLVVLFERGPSLSSNDLAGIVKLKNQSNDNYDLTVIVVAINQIGKAFALGYQHFPFAAQSEQSIPFSSTLPNGTYIVHVDAIAKVAARNLTRYSSLQTQASILVDVNR